MSDLDLSAAEVVATDVIRDFQGRIPYSQLARQVVIAAAPLIAAQVRERIAQEIENEEFTSLSDVSAEVAREVAAGIARGGAR